MNSVRHAHDDLIGDSAESSRRRLVADGVTWTVRLYAGYDRRRGPDLLFESDGVVRRVRDYPADWFTLPAAALFALCLAP